MHPPRRHLDRRGRPRRGRYHVLIPLTSLSEAGALLPAARVLTQQKNGQVTILYMIRPLERGPDRVVAAEVERVQQALGVLLDDYGLNRERVAAVVLMTEEVWREIIEMVDRLNIDLVILGWRDESPLQVSADQSEHHQTNVIARELVVIRSEEEAACGSPRAVLFSPKQVRYDRSEERAEAGYLCANSFDRE